MAISTQGIRRSKVKQGDLVLKITSSDTATLATFQRFVDGDNLESSHNLIRLGKKQEVGVE